MVRFFMQLFSRNLPRAADRSCNDDDNLSLSQWADLPVYHPHCADLPGA